jgi:hypothetical protein
MPNEVVANYSAVVRGPEEVNANAVVVVSAGNVVSAASSSSDADVRRGDYQTILTVRRRQVLAYEIRAGLGDALALIYWRLCLSADSAGESYSRSYNRGAR